MTESVFAIKQEKCKIDISKTTWDPVTSMSMKNSRQYFIHTTYT